MMEETPEFEFTIRPQSDVALAQYVIYFTGLARCWDDELADEKQVGEIDGVRIDIAAAEVDGLNIDEIIESVSPELAEFRAKAFKDGKCLLPNKNNQLSECESLVFIDRLYIEPEFRGRGLGSELMRRMSQMIDVENALIGLKAYPLKEEYDSVRSPESVQKVRNFYAKLGFKYYGDDFMKKNGYECYAIKKRIKYRSK